MTVSLENRQHLISSNEQERMQRESDARQLVNTIVGRHGEFFADPENRLEMLQTQDADDFYKMAQHVNARLRGETPHLLRRDENEKGAFLPAMHTPSLEDKVPAFRKGYQAIQEYIADSPDSIDKKITSVAMAMEALVIWTHPFNDGNGRTSRFLAKLIEEGAKDVDSLISEAVSGSERRRVYSERLATKEGELETANNEDIMLDDDERDALRAKAESLPNDIDAMYLSIQHLLNDEVTQQHTLRHVTGNQGTA